MPAFLVMDIHYVHQLTFWSCPECMFSMKEEPTPISSNVHRLVCQHCQDSYTMHASHRKFKLMLTVCDIVSRQIYYATVFGKSMESVVGCTGYDYHRMYQCETVEGSAELYKILIDMLQGETISLLVTSEKTTPESPYPKLTCHSMKVCGDVLKAGTLVGRLNPLEEVENHLLDLSLLPKTEIEQALPCRETEEQSNRVDQEVSWYDSLVEEFNQTLLTEDIGNNKNVENWDHSRKRSRVLLSQDNTPSAPVRSKSKISETSLAITPKPPGLRFFTPIRLLKQTHFSDSLSLNLMDSSISDDTLITHAAVSEVNSGHNSIVSSTPYVNSISSGKKTPLIEKRTLDPSRDLFSSYDATKSIHNS